MNIRNIPRAVLFALTLLLVVLVAALATVRVTPSVRVKLELTPAARARLVESRLPICVTLTVAGGVRGERRCLFDAGDVVFGAHPYVRRGGNQLILRTAGYPGGPTQHAFRCPDIVRPIGKAADVEITVRCDLR